VVVKRYLAYLFVLPITALGAWSPTVGASATWDSNVTNADRASDRISALQIRSDGASTRRFSLSRDDAISVRLEAAGEAWPAYPALSAVSAGTGAEWQHKFGLGAFAPVLATAFSVDGIAARDSERRGANYQVGVAVRKRLTALSRIELTETASRRDDRASVYDRDGAETVLALTQILGPRAQLGLAGFWRRGDIISYATPPRPDLIALAPRRQLEDTFGPPRVAYAIRADSVGARWELGSRLNAATSVTLGYEYRETRRAGLRYVNQLVSASLALQF
jgi:hypothetical protein